MSVGDGWPAVRPSFASCLDPAMCIRLPLGIRIEPVGLLLSVFYVYAVFSDDCCFTRSASKHLICFDDAIIHIHLR